MHSSSQLQQRSCPLQELEEQNCWVCFLECWQCWKNDYWFYISLWWTNHSVRRIMHMQVVNTWIKPLLLIILQRFWNLSLWSFRNLENVSYPSQKCIASSRYQKFWDVLPLTGSCGRSSLNVSLKYETIPTRADLTFNGLVFNASSITCNTRCISNSYFVKQSLLEGLSFKLLKFHFKECICPQNQVYCQM